MNDMIIAICQNADEAERYKQQIKDQSPDTKWKTRIIPGIDSLALQKLEGNQVTKLWPDSPAAFYDDAAILVIWAED